ncbi:MAG TPA: hypothetical protein VE262_21920 [Blastocatellia bacterium]|nr:hypothetical protein [Blastocatellia bacterium]
MMIDPKQREKARKQNRELVEEMEPAMYVAEERGNLAAEKVLIYLFLSLLQVKEVELRKLCEAFGEQCNLEFEHERPKFRKAGKRLIKRRVVGSEEVGRARVGEAEFIVSVRGRVWERVDEEAHPHLKLVKSKGAKRPRAKSKVTETRAVKGREKK